LKKTGGIMDFEKLTKYEKDNYKHICFIEERMKSIEDQNFIMSFFEKM